MRFFACLPSCACQSDANGFILYDDAKYVILLIKIKIVLNSSCSLKLSSGNAFVCGAGGLRFKSLAGQIEHSVANGSSPLQHFFEKSCVVRVQ